MIETASAELNKEEIKLFQKFKISAHFLFYFIIFPCFNSTFHHKIGASRWAIKKQVKLNY